MNGHIIPIKPAVPADPIDDEELSWRALGCNGTCDQGRAACTCGVELRRRAYYAAIEEDSGVALDMEEVREVAVVIGACLVAFGLLVAVVMGWLPW